MTSLSPGCLLFHWTFLRLGTAFQNHLGGGSKTQAILVRARLCRHCYLIGQQRCGKNSAAHVLVLDEPSAGHLQSHKYTEYTLNIIFTPTLNHIDLKFHVYSWVHCWWCCKLARRVTFTWMGASSLPLRNYPSFPQPHREWQLWVNAGGLQMPQSEVDDPLTRRGSQMNELALQNEWALAPSFACSSRNHHPTHSSMVHM